MNTPAPTTQMSDWGNVPNGVADARADIAAGRTIPYEEVRRWLLTCGTKDEMPPPKCTSS